MAETNRTYHSKLTPELIDEIYNLIKKGNHESIAAMSAGVSPELFHSWLLKGRKQKKGIYFLLAFYVEMALAESEVYAVGKVQDGMDEDWRAAMSFLERRFQDRWNKANKTEVTGKDGGDIHIKSVVDRRREEAKTLEEWKKEKGYK
jgi:hypothetical protein